MIPLFTSIITNISVQIRHKSLHNRLANISVSFYNLRHNRNLHKMTIPELKESQTIVKVYDNVIKSDNDKRLYRGLELSNGLKVMLISDPSTDKSSASLDVHIGHMSDPPDVPGLAHFLEHMLFLGTKKYPEENDYGKFITQHGGQTNAFTSSSHTNYFFDVSPESLVPSLDRFAQFFISPLFTESATNREMCAVNSEHERNLDSDSHRVSQLEKSLSNPNHDYSKFGTGNLETLSTIPKAKGINVREELLAFHEKWYSSNIMSLAVLGKESLDELTEIVVPLFCEIQNKSVTIPEWNEHPYTPEFLKKQVFIVPIKDTRSLSIVFPMPDLNAHYKTRPGHYIAHLIGHEGTGSLLSELKAKGLCTVLYGYYYRSAKGFGFFNISVDLTEEGIECTDDIITMVFQYLNMLKKEGPKEWIFKECKMIDEIRFQFKDKERPFTYVYLITSSLRDFPMNEVLIADNILTEYDPKLITEVLNQLTPEQMKIAIIGKKFQNIVDSKEQWYRTEYKIIDVSEQNLEKWRNAGLNDKLSLPLVNEFIPEKLNLFMREDKVMAPQMIKNTPFSRVWYMQDNEYLLPKALYAFTFSNPLVYANALNYNLTAMFTRLFSDALNEYSYSADLAGIFYYLSTCYSGLYLEIGGYNDKLKTLLSKVLDKMINFDINPKRFEILKEIYIRGLKNHVARPMSDLLRYHTNVLMSEKCFTYEELIESSDDLTIEKLHNFLPQLVSQFHIESLIHGNVTKSEAINMIDFVENEFKTKANTKPLAQSQHLRNREFEIENESFYVFETITEIHQTKGIQMYFQTGVQTPLSNALLEMIGQLLEEPFFNQLRTQEQLGYLTWSSIRRNHGVQGLLFTIQSNKTPLYLDERIEVFLKWADNYLKEISDEEYETNKSALIIQRLEKPKQLLKFSRKLWCEIESKHYFFDRDDVEVQHIRDMKKEDVYDYFKKYIKYDAPYRKKLSVRILSLNATNEIESETVEKDVNSIIELPKPKVIRNINEFKNSLGLYPLPEPRIDIYNLEQSKL